jgi:hypothetical protein
MRRLLIVLLMAGVLQGFNALTAAAGGCAAKCRAGCPSCCNAPQPCQEVLYEEKQCTFYKTVYEQVMEKVTVNAVKYVEETEYRCCNCTTWQPRQDTCCAPVKACAPATCGPAAVGSEMAPVQCVRKVPYTVCRPVSYQKTEERPRVVVKQVPYTVTCCVPKVVGGACAPAAQCYAPCDQSK